jgi:hypothetical protein
LEKSKFLHTLVASNLKAMNYEQKYKEDLKAAKGWLAIAKKDNNTTATQILENLFPELKENEDEKNIKDLIDELKRSLRAANCQNDSCGGGHEKRIALLEWAIAWFEKQKEPNTKDFGEFINELSKQFPEVSFAKLSRIAVMVKNLFEKQGEQKTEIEYIYPKFRIGDVIVQTQPNGNSQPVRVLSISKKNQSYCCESDDHNVYSSIPIRCENEYKLVEQKPAWSEEDEAMLFHIIEHFEWFYKEFHPDVPTFEIGWLKSLKDRVQPNKEWSKEDSERLDRIYKFIWANRKGDTDEIYQQEQDADWLMTLKLKTHWKPSEEQLRAIINSVQGLYQCKEKEVLLDLYEQLKQL